MNNAGIVSRGVAALIDILVVMVIMAALYLGLVLMRLALNPTSFSFPALNGIFSTAVTVFVSVAYLTGCWAVSGCTVGAVAYVLFPLGLIWVAVDRQRRSVQDIVFGSRVVYIQRVTG